MADELEMRTSWEGGKLNVNIRNGAVVFADRIDPQSQISRMRFKKALAVKIPAANFDEIDEMLMASLDSKKDASSAAVAQPDDSSHTGDVALAAMPEEVRDAAARMLRSDDLVAQILTDAEQIGITGEHELVLTTYVVGTSRLLGRPLSECVQGSSGSGKSHTVECVASMFPPEARLMATDVTPNALYYLPQGALRHRAVFAGERSRGKDDERAEATRALREMIASGVLRKLIPIKKGDTIESVLIESEGPIAFVETTTSVELFNEDANRVLLLGSDDSAAQTRRVLDAIAARAASEQASAEVGAILARHHAAQRMLRRVTVQVPFARALAAAMPSDRPDARRAISQVLGVVQAIALLFQFRRVAEPAHGTVIQATRDDYAIARELLLAPLGRALGGGLPPHVITFYEWLRSAVTPTEEFTTAQLEGRRGCRWKRSQLYELVRPLAGCGSLTDAGRDGRSVKYRLGGPLPEAGASWLPAAEDLTP